MNSFVVRPAREEDLEQLYSLARQFTLLNLSADRAILRQKIEQSIKSFAGELPKEKAHYLFVMEEQSTKTLAGSSQIIAKHGTPQSPHVFFKILTKNKVSSRLGMGFIHHVLRFSQNEDGPTEIGGLVVDRAFRRRPEKLGMQISLARFLYMALKPERFETRILSELAPPLTEEGRSEFWEAVGRRFTGLPYTEADRISQNEKEFIQSLFPQEDIYLCLLDANARLVMGQVSPETVPAQHLLRKLGFKYLNEVDPFDGGPHYGADRDEIALISGAQICRVKPVETGHFDELGFIGFVNDKEFRCVYSAYQKQAEEVRIPTHAVQSLNVEQGQKVLVSKWPVSN